MTPLEQARACAAAMWAADAASKWLGMTLVEVGEGSAVLRLTVEDHHCNGLGVCHGGVTFALADSAFAFACNSRNQRTVAQHNQISYLAPAHAGDALTASAREVSRAGRSGLYDVRVTKADQTVVAEFRGACRTIGGTLIDAPGDVSAED